PVSTWSSSGWCWRSCAPSGGRRCGRRDPRARGRRRHHLRDRHVPAPPAHPVAHRARARHVRQRGQPVDDADRRAGRRAAVRGRQRAGSDGRPHAPGDEPHHDRHQPRDHRPAARARVPQLHPHRRRRGRGRPRGPPHRAGPARGGDRRGDRGGRGGADARHHRWRAPGRRVDEHRGRGAAVNVVLPLLVALPLLGAGLNMALWRQVRVQQALGTAFLGAALVMSLVLLAHVADEGPVSVHLAGWPAPIGITLVADVFSALLLVVAVATLLAVFVYAVGQPRADKGAFYFHSLYLMLSAGVAGSLLAGDLFNLFVAFEVMLASSYVLITLGGSRDQVRSGMTYLIINL